MEESLIMEKINQLYRRYRATLAWSIISRFTFFGIITAAIFLAFIKFTGFFIYYYYYFFIPVLAAVILGFIYYRSKRVPLIEVSLKCDERLCLKERLSTALEWIQDQRERTPMFRGLLRDTSNVSREIMPVSVFPFEWKKPARELGASIAALSLLIWMPPLSLFLPKVDPSEVKLIHKEAKKIKEAAQKMEKKLPKSPRLLKTFKNTARSLKKLSVELQRQDINKRNALSKISNLQDKIQQELTAKKQLERAEEILRSSADTGRDQNQDNERNALDRLSKKLKNLASHAKDQNMSNEEKKKIKQELEKIKEQMKKAGISVNNIEKALDYMKQGDMEKVSNELTKAAEQMQQNQNELDDMQDLEEAFQNLDESKKLISGRELADKFRGKRFKKGEGEGEADFGTESTNLEQKTDKPAGNKYVERHSNERNQLKEMFQKLYKPERMEKEAATGRISGQIGKGPVVRSLRTNQRGAPRTGDKARIDASESYLEYKTRGEEAVKQEKIPSRYKNLIREYYDSIDPSK